MPAIGRRTALPVLTALILALGIACGSGDGDKSVVIGQVTNVVPASLTALAEFEVIDDNGALWQFEARGFVGLTPSHLEEHAALGQPVRVEYFEEDGRLVITIITDG